MLIHTMDDCEHEQDNLDKETEPQSNKMVQLTEETNDSLNGESYRVAAEISNDPCTKDKQLNMQCLDSDKVTKNEDEKVGDKKEDPELNNHSVNEKEENAKLEDGKANLDLSVSDNETDTGVDINQGEHSQQDKTNSDRTSEEMPCIRNCQKAVKFPGGIQLTEENVEMFTKMQYFNLNKEPGSEKIEDRYPSASRSVNDFEEDDNDTENDNEHQNSHNPQLRKALLDSKSDIMRFAEVLYKCTLCTSIPSILTSKSNFIKHVRENHFTVNENFKVCKMCSLKFRTEEDLKRHEMCIHTSSERLSPLETGSDVIRKEFCNTAENESDSDSSGHRSFKAKVLKRSKPHVSDFENPKQLVDHAGIETLDGSLDLSKKDARIKGEKVGRINCHYTTQENIMQSHKNKNSLSVQHITDQIMKSNLHGRSIGSQSEQRLPFTPSYTQEFGKYTKLVREGGNIVYFCQVCNWMSPVKAHFQAHCSAHSHIKKVQSTNEQEQGDQTDNQLRDRCSHNKSPNVCIGSYDLKYRPASHNNILNIPNTSNYSKYHEASMFYSYIRPRSLTHCVRTPVVSGQGFQDRSDMLYRKQVETSENQMNIPYRKRKRASSTKMMPNSSLGQSYSDSDSDELSGDKESPSHCSMSSMSLLRNKLLQGKSEMLAQSPVHNDFLSAAENTSKSGTMENNDTHVINEKKCDFERRDYESDIVSLKRKSTCNSPGEEITEKCRKRDEAAPDRNCRETECSLFKLYKCMSCPFEYSNLEEYEQHFSKVHVSSERLSQTMFPKAFSSSPFGTQQGHMEGQQAMKNCESNSMTNVEMGENWRVQKLKELLPDFLEVNDKGNTSRDYLLQCISVAAGISDAPLWSSACNKAVREIFPNSLAQRKGKYKKTYYFGLSMLDSFQGQEDFTALDADGQIFQPIRDINADMEKIMENLPSIIHWNGCMDSGIYRSDILSVLADILDEPDILSWGTQCNRAIKLVFPMVDLKRKGKFKTTKYFGVSFNQNIGPIPHKSDLLVNATNPTKFRIEKNEEHDDSSRETTQIQSNIQNSSMARDPNKEPTETETSGKLVPVFPQWFKEEAQSQMEQYLTKFGGVFEDTGQNICKKTEDEDNDGDDEGESIDDTVGSH